MNEPTLPYVLVYTRRLYSVRLLQLAALREVSPPEQCSPDHTLDRAAALYGACGVIERDRQYALCTVHAKCTTFYLTLKGKSRRFL